MNHNGDQQSGHHVSTSRETGSAPASEEALRRIGNALHGLRFGSVVVIVQDGVVIQIERTEKTRLNR